MKKNITLIGIISIMFFNHPDIAQNNHPDFPQAEISNKQVTMKLYLPDPEKGYYRATRFDWSGIIASATYKGHNYFEYWKTSHNPLIHEDLSGPVESYNKPGLGFEEAGPGGHFIRIGVGILERPDNQDYETFKTYKIVDNGKWDIRKGKDWIEFEQTLQSDIGYGYVYTKRIALKKPEPGFTITHTLRNTGQKKIETDQFNHNFFIIDGEKTGPDITVDFPFKISTTDDLKGLVELEGQTLTFLKDLNDQSVWMELKGYGPDIQDHRITVRNTRTGAGVTFGVDRQIYQMVFWACGTTYCPENYIWISVEPGKEETWISDYTFFVEK